MLYVSLCDLLFIFDRVHHVTPYFELYNKLLVHRTDEEPVGSKHVFVILHSWSPLVPVLRCVFNGPTRANYTMIFIFKISIKHSRAVMPCKKENNKSRRGNTSICGTYGMCLMELSLWQ